MAGGGGNRLCGTSVVLVKRGAVAGVRVSALVCSVVAGPKEPSLSKLFTMAAPK